MSEFKKADGWMILAEWIETHAKKPADATMRAFGALAQFRGQSFDRVNPRQVRRAVRNALFSSGVVAGAMPEIGVHYDPAEKLLYVYARIAARNRN